jgi:hypothetical protein
VSNAFFIVAVGFAVTLAAVLAWTLRPAHRRRKSGGLSVLESAPQHLCNMGAIRQSQDPNDLLYVTNRGNREVATRLRRERKNVALLYLNSLQSDFEQLLRIARVVALLSPEISSAYEYERLRLSVLFRLRFALVKFRFMFGNAAMPQLTLLGEMVTSLAIRMEAAMEKLGERAVLAADVALQSER